MMTTAGEPKGSTSTYSKEISSEQAQDIDDWWTDLEASGANYNYGGKAVDSSSTYCTESVVDSLNDTGVLDSSESAIVNAPYAKWGQSFPSIIPNGLQKLANALQNLVSPNPNEFEERVSQLKNLHSSPSGNTP